MYTQRMLISILILGLISFAVESVAIGGVVMIPDTQVSGSLGTDRDTSIRERLACIPHQIRENLAPSTQGSRAYPDSARPDPGWNLPPGEPNMPNIFPLVRIPLERTVRHQLSPNLDPPEPNEEISQPVDLAEDPLHLRLTDPLPRDLC
jgi:hypothetical protein